jgi:hypothetical protein
VFKALLGQRFTIQEFRDLDDISVWHCFKLWTNNPDPILASLCRGLLFRGLYKTIDLTHRVTAEQAREAVGRAEHAITQAGGEAKYELFYDEPADTPYETFDPKTGIAAAGAPEITVINAAGTATRFAEMSPMSQSLNRELMFRRIHVKGEWKEVAEKAIG